MMYLHKWSTAEITMAINGETKSPQSGGVKLSHKGGEDEGYDMERPLALNNIGGGNELGVKVQEHTQFKVKSDTRINSREEQKKLKRIISNRLSAKNTRAKKANYQAQLESTLLDLEAQVSTLSTQIQHENQQVLRLRVENRDLSQTLNAFAESESFKDAQIEKSKAEIKKLKEGLMTGNFHELKKREEQMKELGFDYSGLDEMTTESFYLQNGPQSLAQINFNQLLLPL